ncbi:MAG: radical SAM family heme chaperone HemW [Bryobacteraceae bacterium]|nr:radical SAM family heme chaperone HemW [Bryobacteraceae bacterium]
MPGIYISWPFCAQKCTYCNFASGVLPRELEAGYFAAVKAEIAATEWPWRPETVYLGGGTPSTMDPGQLAELLSLLPGAPWAEATIEAAPGSLTAEKARAWREAGINRVSLGVQSFIDVELRRTGRKHDAATVAADVELLRGAGLPNVSIDLIAGLPGQTAEGWAESLGWVRRLDVPHASVYMLEVDDDSRLGREMLLGGVRYGAADVPDEVAIVRYYEEAVAGLGLARYEISNFARAGFESLHNLKYWRREAYFGFGADAHSFDGRVRWQNAETAAEYVARFARGERTRVDESEAIAGEERWFVGLRLSEGVEATPEDWARHGAVLRRFVEEGLLEEQGGRVRLTARGILLSNEIFEEFLAPCP